MRSKTCCFTGRHQIPPGERAEIADKLGHIIAGLYPKGIRYYGTSGALGLDTLAAQTVIRLRESCPSMKLILVLPCLTQTRGRPEDMAEYESIKAQADKVGYTSQEYTKSILSLDSGFTKAAPLHSVFRIATSAPCESYSFTL